MQKDHPSTKTTKRIMATQSYRELIAWQKAMVFVELVYKHSAGFPIEERYGLTAQLRGSAVSIPSNIAEGQGRGPGADFVRFLAIARGSLNEAQTQILIAERLKYLNGQQTTELISLSDEVGRLINGLKSSVSRGSRRKN